jgi:hypothetical protein
VLLSNEFGDRTVELLRPTRYCNAVDKNSEGVTNPAAHLTCYKVRERSTVDPELNSTDQFGDLSISVRKGSTELCVPTAENGMPIPNINSFEMIRARTTPRTQKFEKLDVTLVDETIFATGNVRKLKQLAPPTAVDGGGITNPSQRLTCYQVRTPRIERRDIDIENMFGLFTVTARGTKTLCVPSQDMVVVVP